MRIQALRAGFLAIVVTVLAGTPTAGQERAPQPTTESIQVHGHWIIELYDSGNLLNRFEFDNAFVSPARLASLLAGKIVVGEGLWSVLATGTGGPCETSDGTQNGCVIVTSDDSRTGNRFFPTLTVTTPTSGDNANTLVLEGSFTAQKDGSISTVHTGAVMCLSTEITPATCSLSSPDAFSLAFTEKILATPILIEARQTANVTVIISFTG